MKQGLFWVSLLKVFGVHRLISMQTAYQLFGILTKAVTVKVTRQKAMTMRKKD